MSIKIENLSKTFTGYKALDNINIEFNDGELTSLLGPSGSGKTTLLRLVAGLEPPDENEKCRIMFNGIDVLDCSVGQRKIGFVFQHYALFRHMTVFENIAFGLRVKKRKERPSNSKITETVNELLHLIQLESLKSRMPSQLSGGQRQRVALARALAIKPDVLLLDEPFGALDVQVRTELRKWLRNLHDTLHFTSVFVTHDQEEALEISDRVVVMNNGKIEQEGTPDEVFHHPVNEFVMHFLGDVNIYHGREDGSSRIYKFSGQNNLDNDKTLLIRPHDFDVLDFEPSGRSFIVAIVRKVQTAGAVVKIEFLDEEASIVVVHLSHDLYDKIKLKIGDRKYLSPRI